MKKAFRKPLLPLLFACLLVCGVALLLLLSENIAGNRRTVEQMYDDARIQFRVLPGMASAAELALPVKKAQGLLDTGLPTQVCTERQCPIALGTPEDGLLVFQTACGTNDPAMLAQNHQLTISYGAGYDDAKFAASADLCLLEAELAEAAGLAPGDGILVAGCLLDYTLEDTPPMLSLTLAGTYTAGEEQRLAGGVLVPDALFSGRDGLLYSSQMEEYWGAYTEFSFILDPAYNRDYRASTETLQTALGQTRDFLLYSDSRVLENAVEPLSRRLQTQDTLLPLLLAALVAGCGLLSVLLAMSWQNDLMIRLVFGERRPVAMGREWCGVCLAFAPGAAVSGAVLLACALGGLAARHAALLWGASLAISLPLPLLTWLLAGGNLIRLYQAYGRNK